MNDTAPRALARGASATLVGSLVGGVLGLALTVLISRTLGDAGAGVVFQAMAVFMITLALTEFGMDTATMWLIPRQMDSDRGNIKLTVKTALVATLVAGTVGSVVVALGAYYLTSGSQVVEAIGVAIVFQPMAAVMTALLAALRAMSGLREYVLINNVLLAAYRPVAVGLCALAGVGAVWVSLAWASSYALGLALALWLTFRTTRRVMAGGEPPVAESRQVVRQLLTFGGSRIISSAAQQVLLWSDVLIVGALLGAEEAGVYGTVVRFFSAILLVDTALRMVVSPMFSKLMHREDLPGLQELYHRNTILLNALSAPLIIVLAVFAPAVLELISPGFGTGASALRVLCLGMLVVLGAGTIHNVLLMSGRSAQAALNKVAAMIVNVLLNFTLIPVVGIAGAALSWVVAMGLDAVLAALQVRKHVGIHPSVRPVFMVLSLAAGTVALPSVLVAFALGQTTGGLITGAGVSGIAFLCGLWLARRPLHLVDLLPVKGD